MPTTTTPISEDALIRERIDTLVQALRAKDINALMAHYARDAVAFDLMPLQFLGAASYRKSFEAWFASVQGPIDYETNDLRVATSGDVAFCNHVARVRTTRTTGEKNDYRVRVTAGLRKIDGKWMVIHEHVSVPFKNGEVMQAALGAP